MSRGGLVAEALQVELGGKFYNTDIYLRYSWNIILDYFLEKKL